MKSVLLVPCATERVAATRYRVCQYVPFLKALGVSCRVYPAISDTSTRLMLASPTMGSWRRRGYYLRVFVERLWRFGGLLTLASRYEAVYLQRATFPFGLERLLGWWARAIIFDFDDSIYRSAPEDGETGWLGRLKERTKRAEVEGILKVSRVAIVENGFLKEYAQRFCSEVETIPGPIDTDHFSAKSAYNDGPPVIGWIGSPSTTAYLPMVEQPLLEVCRRHPAARVRLVGAAAFRFMALETDSVPWSLESEVRELQGFDIGIMPMPNDDWTNGKLGVKMLLYMSVGVPVVVSYTRTNAEVIEHGVNGFLARSFEDWVDIVSKLTTDAALRRRIGQAGRRTVVERFSLKVGAPKLAAILERLGQR